jgi:hypothetical protein
VILEVMSNEFNVDSVCTYVISSSQKENTLRIQ